MFLRAVRDGKTIALMAVTKDTALKPTEREMKFIIKFEELGCEILTEPKKKKKRGRRWATDVQA